MEPLVQVENLSVNYGGVQALHGVSFELPAGRIVAVVGPNGAGKTTLFRRFLENSQSDQGRSHRRARSVRVPSAAQVVVRGTVGARRIVALRGVVGPRVPRIHRPNLWSTEGRVASDGSSLVAQSGYSATRGGSDQSPLCRHETQDPCGRRLLLWADGPPSACARRTDRRTGSAIAACPGKLRFAGTSYRTARRAKDSCLSRRTIFPNSA